MTSLMPLETSETHPLNVVYICVFCLYLNQCCLIYINESMISTKKRKAGVEDEDLLKNWREVLGNPPKRSDGLKVKTFINTFSMIVAEKQY